MPNAKFAPPGRRLDQDSDSTSLHMVVTKTWLARISEHADQLGITRSEAIRRLVDQALTAAK